MDPKPLNTDEFDRLMASVRQCQLCEAALPSEPRPVLQLAPTAKILIAGQAPGRRVHETGIPFDDPSGKRLREWMGVSSDVFYDSSKIAILPMAFCYPGTGRSGDLPPRPECQQAWRQKLLDQLLELELTLVIGQYAHAWHLEETQKNLTETVRSWRAYDDHVLPLPHPSPRNNIWLKKNPWFAESLLPHLKRTIRRILAA